MLTKPAWMRTADYGALILRYNMAPACAHCGTIERLTVDHVIPRADGGSDDIGNLQVLCQSCNSSKGARPDWYWQRRFYWDGPFDPEAFWTAQRIGVHDLLMSGLNGRAAEWFSRDWSQVSRRLYLLAWVVGAGKTMGIPALAFSLNALLRQRNGAACRRVDRILVLAKERAIRDQIAKDLHDDIPKYGIGPIAPRVGVLDVGWKWDSGALDQADVWVACVQQLFEENGRPRENLTQILAGFPLIVCDEPHYANAQVLRIVDAAQTSLCFGLTSTPIEADGEIIDRFVLVSLYGYDDAIGNDQSLKLLMGPRRVAGSDRPELPEAIFDELGVKEAEILRAGEAGFVFDTKGIRYGIQAPPIQSVAERVVHYLGECDTLAVEEETPADHRPKGTPATLRYAMHGMIVVETIEIGKALTESLNRWFESDRRRFPLERGFRATLVRSDVRADGGEIDPGLKLTTDHPWMAAKDNDGKLAPNSARVLVVVGMAREGVNNPLCGVVGLACPTRSVVEIVQRAIGRPLRAFVERRGKVLERVPPWRLDTIRIVSHVGFDNRPAVEAGVKFVLNMADALDGIPTLEDVINEHEPASDIIVDDTGGLSKRARIEIAGEVGLAIRNGLPIDKARLVDEYGGGLEKKRRRVVEWVDLLQKDPMRAAERLYHYTDLETETIVVREDAKVTVTDADIRQHIYAQHTDLVPTLGRMDDPVVRSLQERLYVDHQRLYRAPDMMRWTDLQRIRKDIVSSVIESMGPFYQWDHQPVWRLVGHAVKVVLGVPETESAQTGGRFDIPACHHILTRPAQRQRIEGFVRGRLIEQGACPELAAAFGVADPYDEGEARDAWSG